MAPARLTLWRESWRLINFDFCLIKTKRQLCYIAIMRKHDLCFFDVETTGLDWAKHEIIEIGFVLAKQIPQEKKGPLLEIKDEGEFKIKPTNLAAADPESLRINNYNTADWVFAYNLKEAIAEFAKRAGNSILVGHNISFDEAFLKRAYQETGVLNPHDFHKIDTISLSYGLLYHEPNVERFSLRALCEHLGIENKKAHSALSDARACFMIYKKLLNIL